jgi:hypothetical protein
MLSALIACGGSDDAQKPETTSNEEIRNRLETAARGQDDLLKRCIASARGGGKVDESKRTELVDLCESAKGGDRAEIVAATRRVCRELALGTIPENSPQRGLALQACDQVGR